MKISQKNLALNLPKDITIQKFLPRIEEEKTRSFITLILTLIAIIIFGFFAISPTLSTISELNKKLADDTFVDARLVEKIANLSKLQQQYSILQPDFSYVYSAVPQEADIPSFIAQIQSIAQNSQVQIVRVQTLPVEVLSGTSTKYTALGYGIDITGSITNAQAFLKLLSTFQRLNSIESITYIKNPVANLSGNTIRMSIKGKLYFQKG